MAGSLGCFHRASANNSGAISAKAEAAHPANYLFVFSRFDDEIGFKRWFARYVLGPHFSPEKGALIGKRHGCISLGEAKFGAEQAMNQEDRKILSADYREPVPP
jgi:hypothetical protein